VQASKEVEYDQLLEKVAIIVDTGNITMGIFREEKLSDFLAKNLHERLTLAGIESKVIDVRGLVTNEEQIERAKAVYGPKQIIGLRPKDGLSVWNENLRDCTFDVVIYDTELGRNVWSGQLLLRQIQTEWGVFIFTVDQMIDAIGNALRQDSLLQ
jgi:hypothetical protein